MPRIDMTPENKAEDQLKFPRLWLDKDQRMRIVCIEKAPEFQWVHTLRAPEIAPDGRPVMEDRTNKDGSTSSQIKFSFIGRHICQGDLGILADKGYDPDHCPACKAAEESDAVRKPERRFAWNVIRYFTKPGTFEPQEPLQVECIVWTFGENVFTSLIDLATTWEDLRKHDLNLGPCTVESFQKFDIQPQPAALWLRDDETKTLVASVYNNNKIEDLAACIAFTKEQRFFDMDIMTTKERYARAFANQSEPDIPATEAADIEDILSAPFDDSAEAKEADEAARGGKSEETGDALPSEPQEPASSDAVADILDGLEAGTPEPEETEGETADFEDLLNL